MMFTAPQARFTPDDVLRLEDEGLYEFVGGTLVKKEVGPLAARTAALIAARLVNFIEGSKSGDRVYAELSFRCFAHDPDLTRRADVALIVASRLAGVQEEGHIPIAPDLAIEIVSSETAARLRTKIRLYLKHGGKAVWAVYPDERVIDLHSANGQITKLEQDQVLEDNDALPGFSTPVNAIFKGL